MSIKRQIVVSMEELEQMPDTSFERDVVCEEEEAFCLSVENITALNVLLNQVRARCTSEQINLLYCLRALFIYLFMPTFIICLWISA